MIKFIFDLIQIAVMVNLVMLVLKWTVFRKFGKRSKSSKSGKGKNSKSIVGKIVLLCKRNIHCRLNDMIKAQKESLAQSVSGTNEQSNLKGTNVIQFPTAELKKV